MPENTIIGGPGPVGAPADDATPTDDEHAGDREMAMADSTEAFHRARVYSLLGLGFDRPGERFRRALEERAFREDLLHSAGVIDGTVAGAAESVGAHAMDPEALHGTWSSLFGVESGIPVSPYQLTYMPGPLVTNVRKLADIRGFYEAFDLEIAPGRNDRHDHLCFELEFLGRLSLRQAYLREVGDDDGVRIVRDAYRTFMEDHVGRWYWRFVDEVSQRDGGFYAALADLLAALVEHEIERLDVSPEWVPDDPAVADWTEGVFGDSGRGCGGCGPGLAGLDGRGDRDVSHLGPKAGDGGQEGEDRG